MPTINNGAIERVYLDADYATATDIVGVYQFMLVDGGGIDYADMWDDVLAIMDSIAIILKAIVTAGTIWRGIRVEDLNGNNSSGPLPFDSPVAGEGADGGIPSGVAALLNMPTGVKKVQLRKYVGVLDKTLAMSGVNLSAGAVSALTDLADVLMAPIPQNGRTYRYGYLSPKTNTFLVPTSANIPLVPSYQRRRKVGVGS